MIFLFGVANALKSDTIYTLMESDEPKHHYKDAVFGGMYIYMATLLIALGFWIKGCLQPTSEVDTLATPEGQAIRHHGAL